jgi:hypothetical protein
VGVLQPPLCGEPVLANQPAEQITPAHSIKVDDVGR